MGIEVQRDGKVLVATMDDGKANALTSAVLNELHDVLGQAAVGGHPLVLAGRDGTFCAGFDLSVMLSGDAGRMLALLAEGRRLYRAVLESPVPVVAACTGHALAGGALLLLSADHRIGRPGPCKIGLNEVRIGMGLPEFAVTLARHRLDPRRLTAAACFAEVATGARAVEVGFLDELAEDPVVAARALAADLADLPPEAFAITKARVRAPLTSDLASIPESEVEVFPPAR